MTEKPRFLEVDGCINCETYTDWQERKNLIEGGLQLHEVLVSCVLLGCEGYGVTVMKPYIGTHEIVEYVRTHELLPDQRKNIRKVLEGRNVAIAEDVDELLGVAKPKPVVLIGGNPKGHSMPFDPETLSGNRLRQIVGKIGLECEIVDMTENPNDVPSWKEVRSLKKRFRNHQVVFLGHFVEKQLQSQFPSGIYLPHPASRRKTDLAKLEQGLKRLRDQG